MINNGLLSVKNAIERTLESYIKTYLSVEQIGRKTKAEMFFDAVERYVAALFVGGQIDNNYIVRSTAKGIKINFTACGGHSVVDYMMLPDALRWKVENVVPQVQKKTVTVDVQTSQPELELKTETTTFNFEVDMEAFMGEKPFTSEAYFPAVQQKCEPEQTFDSAQQAYDYAIKIVT